MHCYFVGGFSFQDRQEITHTALSRSNTTNKLFRVKYSVIIIIGVSSQNMLFTIRIMKRWFMVMIIMHTHNRTRTHSY